MADVDNGAWDGPAAMSYATQTDDPAAAYAAICAGRKAGDPSLQSSWALPHHAHPGDPPNATGVRNALSRLPQTQGLTNHDQAQAHLDAHLATIHNAGLSDEETPAVTLGEHRQLDTDAELTTLSVSERRLGLKLLTYNKVVDSRYGPLMFQPGAFGEVDPKQVRLRMDHQDPPTGLGQSFLDRQDAPLMDFKVSKTQRGDEQLTLANDGVSRGVSVGYDDVAPGPVSKLIDGRRVLVYGPNSARLAEVSTTWTPTFAEPSAGVVYVLSKDEKGKGQMAETQDAPVVGADPTVIADIRRELADRDGATNEKLDKVLGAFDQWREEQRANFRIPEADKPRHPKLHDWVEAALRTMRGQKLSDTLLHELALDDVVTTDNPGLVPDVLVPDYDDLINQNRPFLQSTRQITAPATGTSMILPIITQRAVAGTQAGNAEKGDLTTTATQVGTGSFAYESVFGGADISIQMINRAERSFFDILTGDMGMAYALDCDTKALLSLLTGYTDSASVSHVAHNGGEMDPEDLILGPAWTRSIQVYKRAPDTIWLNAQAVGAFIDAKSPATNAPLYSNLAAAFTAGGGPGGTLSGLRPVYVPALDNLTGHNVDAIVGPSRGFVWAEDPARNLQVDVPSKAGRDIALVGGIFPAPRFADAFTFYHIAAS